MNEEIDKGYYTIRSISISNHGSGWRDVLQYHYSSWPDHQAPRNCDQFLEFVKIVNEYHTMQTKRGSIVVHCRYK